MVTVVASVVTDDVADEVVVVAEVVDLADVVVLSSTATLPHASNDTNIKIIKITLKIPFSFFIITV